jgi:hypothetical protein
VMALIPVSMVTRSLAHRIALRDKTVVTAGKHQGPLPAVIS